MPLEGDWENEPKWVIQRVLEKLGDPDMNDFDWEVLAAKLVPIVPLERFEQYESGTAPPETNFSNSERARALKDLYNALIDRDKERAIVEADLALTVWGS